MNYYHTSKCIVLFPYSFMRTFHESPHNSQACQDMTSVSNLSK